MLRAWNKNKLEEKKSQIFVMKQMQAIIWGTGLYLRAILAHNG
jgi:hypothetical protein